MRRSHLQRLCLFVGLVVFVAGPSWGRGQPASDKGQELALQAVDLARSGRYAEALEFFEQSYALTPDPIILYNIGRVASRLGNLARARETLELYMQQEKDPAALERAHAALEDVLARWKGSILVTSSIPGATVALDGASPQPLPLSRPVDVSPGRHVVAVAAEGYGAFEREVEVRAGEAVQVVAELVSLSVAATPAPVPSPPTGSSANDLSGTVVPQSTPDTRSGLSTLSWVLIGTGAAALVGGGVTTYFLLRDRGPGSADLTWTVR